MGFKPSDSDYNTYVMVSIYNDGVTIKYLIGYMFITITSLRPHLFLFGWLKLNLISLLDQFILA